jgi:hypothetical protein
MNFEGFNLDFLRGVMTTGYFVVALFFLRFWKESRDRLFALFAVAFVVLAVRNLLRSLFQEPDGLEWYPYAVRLLAYVIILFAIIDKNLRRTEKRP